MNEKLKELAVEAKIQMVSEPRLDNFAELIIAACISAIEEGDFRDMIYTTHDRGYAQGIKERCIKSIKDKFEK